MKFYNCYSFNQKRQNFKKKNLKMSVKNDNFNKIYVYQIARQLLREDLDVHQDSYRQTIKQ